VKLNKKVIKIQKDIDAQISKLLQIKGRITDLEYEHNPASQTVIAAKQAGAASRKFEYIEQAIWDLHTAILRELKK